MVLLDFPPYTSKVRATAYESLHLWRKSLLDFTDRGIKERRRRIGFPVAGAPVRPLECGE